MRPLAISPITGSDMLKALGDPMRWEIIRQMSEVEELACSTLESTLAISKPTISYHMKILIHAGLVLVRKEGRFFFYTLQRDVLKGLIEEMSAFAS